MNINITQAPPEGEVERLARILCETWGDIPDRLYDGLFVLPYEEVTVALQEGVTYYYDNLITTVDGQPVPQIKGFRYWCEKAVIFLGTLKNNKLVIKDEVIEETTQSKEVLHTA